MVRFYVPNAHCPLPFSKLILQRNRLNFGKNSPAILGQTWPKNIHYKENFLSFLGVFTAIHIKLASLLF